eukprot:7267283-Prymnesium_polylepis.4
MIAATVRYVAAARAAAALRAADRTHTRGRDTAECGARGPKVYDECASAGLGRARVCIEKHRAPDGLAVRSAREYSARRSGPPRRTFTSASLFTTEGRTNLSPRAVCSRCPTYRPFPVTYSHRPCNTEGGE